MNNEYVNRIIEQEIRFSDELASNYNYPDNITHLLYLIIPAFIIKYGNTHRELLESCFKNVPIKINDKQDTMFQAYYVSVPKYDNGEVVTTKRIVLQNYKNISLIQLLDNLVHEYNHAINSMQNEINITETVNIRTGINQNYYDKKNLNFIGKSDEIILEEVINTRQTETVIDIIKNFSNMDISNTTVSNTLYSIYHTVGSGYRSNSYYLESYACKVLMENRTFISTFETLRFDGQIDDLHYFFDNITGKSGSLKELARLLNKSLEMQKELSNVKFFKNRKIEKIKDITKKAMEIVELFNKNTIYK